MIPLDQTASDVLLESQGDIGGSGPCEDVIRIYQGLEPAGADTWNPLNRDRELEYRLAVYRHLCVALRMYTGELARMRVLDVGCGNGRSTRVYLDFGFSPGQLQGIDLRRGAIALARATHSGIRFVTYDGSRLPMADGSLDWISLSTVMSSVPTADARRRIAQECSRVLAAGGYLFYFDSLRAHGSAEAPLPEPQSVFPALMGVSDQTLRLETPEPSPDGTVGLLSRIRHRFRRIPTHRTSLFRKPLPPGS